MIRIEIIVNTLEEYIKVKKDIEFNFSKLNTIYNIEVYCKYNSKTHFFEYDTEHKVYKEI